MILNRNLLNRYLRLHQFCSDFNTPFEPCRLQIKRCYQRSRQQFITGRVVSHESAIYDPKRDVDEQHARRKEPTGRFIPIARAATINNHCRIICGCQQADNILWFVFQIGVLEQNPFPNRCIQSTPNCRRLPSVLISQNQIEFHPCRCLVENRPSCIR